MNTPPPPGAADGQFCLSAPLLHLYPVCLSQSPDPRRAALDGGLLKMGSSSKFLSQKATFKPRRAVTCSVWQITLQIKFTIKPLTPCSVSLPTIWTSNTFCWGSLTQFQKPLNNRSTNASHEQITVSLVRNSLWTPLKVSETFNSITKNLHRFTPTSVCSLIP